MKCQISKRKCISKINGIVSKIVNHMEEIESENRAVRYLQSKNTHD